MKTKTTGDKKNTVVKARFMIEDIEGKSFFINQARAFEQAENILIKEGRESITVYELKAIHTIRRTIDFTTKKL